MRMTIKEFLDRLKQTPRDWIINEGNIRRDSNYACPVTAVLGMDGEMGFIDEAEEAGIPESMQIRIMDASDGSFREKPEESLRKRILRATGLDERM